MKKRSLFIALAAILVGCAIGGAMAYYTNQSAVTNVVTAGNVRVELQEWADKDMTVPYADPENDIIPGENVSKVVTAKNVGTGDAWIRIQFVTTAEGDEIPEEGAMPLSVDVDTEGWTLQDGWYYYNTTLKTGETATPLFTTVSFDSAMDGDWESSIINIDVTLQAVQVAHNGETVFEAAGWPA